MTPKVVLLFLLAGPWAQGPVGPGPVQPSPGARPPVAITAGPVRALDAPPEHRPDPLVTWNELVAERSLRLGQRVRLQVQLHSFAETWNPYITRFGPAEFVCLVAWSDEQFPWVREHYDEPAVRLFVRRGSVAEKVFAEAGVYKRFEVVVDLCEILRDRPWGEIVAARPLERSLGEGTVIHAARAYTLLGNGTRALATDELRRALGGSPPEAARKELERLLALCSEPQDKRARDL